jgi:beta-phosphoglucomutase-like phosphatase (HAD superfamily)
MMVTSNDITNGKPNPEPYLKGASLLGFPAANCIVLEDAPAGIRSGKSSGARVIAFHTTMHESKLIEAGADWVVNDCSAIGLDGAGETRLLNIKLNY